MFWLLTALVVLLFLLLLIIFTKLTILINYYHHNDNDDLKVQFKVWFGLIKYKMNIPLIKIDDNSPSVVIKGKTHMGEKSDETTKDKEIQITPDNLISKIKDAKETIKHVINMNVIVRKFLKKTSIKQFEWHSLIGVGDAAYTGMSTGALWTIKAGIVGILSHYIKLKELPNLSVTPHFQVAIIQTRITCIFQFRIGYAILAGLKIIKFWKGGRPKLKKNENYSKKRTKSV